MSYSCPLNFENVDSNISRFSSLLVSLLVISYLITFNIFILYFLFYDFLAKLFCQKKYSIIYQISKLLKNLFRMKDVFSDGGAKRLAGFFGLFFILLLIAGNNLNLYVFSMVVGVIFIGCSLLDALFNYCLGCKIYFIIKKVYPGFMN